MIEFNITNVSVHVHTMHHQQQARGQASLLMVSSQLHG